MPSRANVARHVSVATFSSIDFCGSISRPWLLLPSELPFVFNLCYTHTPLVGVWSEYSIKKGRNVKEGKIWERRDALAL